MSKAGSKPGAEALAKRAELEDFCKTTLKPGRHFGTIHRKGCTQADRQEWDNCPNCKSRPSLYQPGAERICEWRNVLIGEPVLQDELVRVAGGQGWVAFCVTLTDRASGDVLGHGVGAAKHQDPNIMVKKAKKNAVIEAVRTTFALSDLFDDADHEGEEGAVQPSAATRSDDRRGVQLTPGGRPRAAARQAAPAPAAPAPSAPAGIEDARSAPAAPPAGPIKAAPPWWKVRAEFPRARWTVLDRDNSEYGIMGVIHFAHDKRPELGLRDKWSPFSPNPQTGKPEFKSKPPFPEWASLTWYGLLEWAIKHRLARAGGDDTNGYNDPFHHLLTDNYICVFKGAVMPIAEHAAAMDYIAWGLVRKNGGAVPEWVAAALDGRDPESEAPAAAPDAPEAPADAPASDDAADSFDLDSDVPF